MISCLCGSDETSNSGSESGSRSKTATDELLKELQEVPVGISESEFIKNLLPTLSTGDLVLFSSPNFGETHKLFKSRWNHLGVVYKRDEESLNQRDRMDERNPAKILLLEATQGPKAGFVSEGERMSGVDLIDLKARVQKFLQAPTLTGAPRVVGIRKLEGAKLSPDSLKGLEMCYMRYKDRAYEDKTESVLKAAVDTAGFDAIEDDSQLFDSELVAYAYQHMGLFMSGKEDNKGTTDTNMTKGDRPASEYSVKDFCQSHENLKLVRGVKFGRELYIVGEKGNKVDESEGKKIKTKDIHEADVRSAFVGMDNKPHPSLSECFEFAKATTMESPVLMYVTSWIVLLFTWISLGLLSIPLIAGWYNMLLFKDKAETLEVGAFRVFLVGDEIKRLVLPSFLLTLVVVLVGYGGFFLFGFQIVLVVMLLQYVPAYVAFQDESFGQAVKSSIAALKEGKVFFNFMVTFVGLVLFAFPLTAPFGLGMLYKSFHVVVKGLKREQLQAWDPPELIHEVTNMQTV